MNYKFLERLTAYTIPVAPVIFFGWRVFVEVLAMTNLLWLSIPAGILTGIALEIVGILAGRSAIEYWKRDQYTIASIAVLILLAYVGIGVWELQGTIGAVVFLIAPLVYILIALGSMLESQDSEIKEDKEHERKIDIVKLKLQHEQKMERIRSKVATPKMQPIVQPKTKPKNETLQPVVSLEGTRKLVYEAYKSQPNATQAEVARMLLDNHGVSVSRQMIGKHKKALNGVLK